MEARAGLSEREEISEVRADVGAAWGAQVRDEEQAEGNAIHAQDTSVEELVPAVDKLNEPAVWGIGIRLPAGTPAGLGKGQAV